MTDFIMVLDKEGRRVFHSPSYKTIVGDLDAIKCTTAFDEIHPEDRAQVVRSLLETLTTGQGHRLEYRLLDLRRPAMQKNLREALRSCSMLMMAVAGIEIRSPATWI